MHFKTDFNIVPRIRSVLQNIGLMVLLYSLSRFCFLILNSAVFKSVDNFGIFKAFVAGLRFDFSVVVMLSVPYIVLVLLPFALYYSRPYQFVLKLVFIVCQCPLYFAHLADIEYFKYTGSRMSPAILNLHNEIKHQFSQLIMNYWHIGLFGVISFAALIVFFHKSSLGDKPSPGRPLRFIAFALVTILSTVVLTRGGFQKKVLQPNHAFLHTKNESLALLALNSSFTILRTKGENGLPHTAHFKSWKEVYGLIESPEFKYHGHKNQNVVIIVLESFATEFWGKANSGHGYTPFLDSLAKEGLFFRNHFANGRRSIEAVPSITMGIPSLMQTPLVNSRYILNKWFGLAGQLQHAGYDTFFFHGAERGTMYFDSMATIAGFEQFYSLENYPESGDFDGHWGIYDEPFMKNMAVKLNDSKRPFLSLLFSISTHQPYPIPEIYKGKFPKGPTQLYESIGYTDNALKKFFEMAKNQPWYKDTLFVITGDHTQMSHSTNYNTMLGRFMVPLLLFHPTIKLEANENKIVQQTDILPTILDFLDVKTDPISLFGRPVWQAEDGRAMVHQNGTYYLVKKSQVVAYDSHANQFQYFEFTDPNVTVPLVPTEEQKTALNNEVLAFIQYYNNGLNDNALYDWQEKSKMEFQVRSYQSF